MRAQYRNLAIIFPKIGHLHAKKFEVLPPGEQPFLSTHRRLQKELFGTVCVKRLKCPRSFERRNRSVATTSGTVDNRLLSVSRATNLCWYSSSTGQRTNGESISRNALFSVQNHARRSFAIVCTTLHQPYRIAPAQEE